MREPHDPEALFLKAKLFVNRALGGEDWRSFEESALWASLALELLAKAALAKVNPLLIADSTAANGRNLMYAAGIADNTESFRTVPAATVFARCAIAFAPFSQSDALKIAYERNAYLHSGAPFAAPLGEEAWWAHFWRLASLLLPAQDRSLEDLVPPTHVAEVKRYLAQNRRIVSDIVAAKVGRAKQRYGLVKNGAVSTKVAADFESYRPLEIVGFNFQSAMACPICNYESAEICGSSADLEDLEYLPEGVLRTLIVETDWYHCRKCGLRLENHDEVEESDVVPTAFGLWRLASEYDVERELE